MSSSLWSIETSLRGLPPSHCPLFLIPTITSFWKLPPFHFPLVLIPHWINDFLCCLLYFVECLLRKLHSSHFPLILILIWISEFLSYQIFFTELAPLGQFSHRVAMSVCISVCLSDCVIGCIFFQPLIGPEITWSVPRPLIGPLPPLLPVGNLKTWKLKNWETW